MPIPAWDPESASRAAFTLRGRIHGNYCGWGHTSPPDTRPVDEVDAACRAHDIEYDRAGGILGVAAADRRMGRRLGRWLDRWKLAAPPPLVRAVDHMRFWIGHGTSPITAPAELLAPFEATPHPEEGEVYEPVERYADGRALCRPGPCDRFAARVCGDLADDWDELEEDRILRGAELLASEV